MSKLILEIKQGESLLIGDDIEIKIEKCGPSSKRIRLYITCPEEINLSRKKESCESNNFNK